MRKIIRVLVLLAVFAIPVLLGFMWLDHLRETKLPRPTGPYAVGRVTYDWINAKHELFAWIWYPLTPTQPSQAD